MENSSPDNSAVLFLAFFPAFLERFSAHVQYCTVKYELKPFSWSDIKTILTQLSLAKLICFTPSFIPLLTVSCDSALPNAYPCSDENLVCQIRSGQALCCALTAYPRCSEDFGHSLRMERRSVKAVQGKGRLHRYKAVG